MRFTEQFFTPQSATFTTPVGTTQAFYATRPDTRFLARGFYGGRVILTREDAAPLLKAADALVRQSFPPGLRVNIRTPMENASGQIALWCGSLRAPECYDHLGEDLRITAPIPDGAPVRAAGILKTYQYGGERGITAFLMAVQVMKPLRTNPFHMEMTDEVHA